MANYNLSCGIISGVLGLIFWIRLPRGTLQAYFAFPASASISISASPDSGATGSARKLDTGKIFFWAVSALVMNIGLTALCGKFFAGANPAESHELQDITKDLLGKIIVFPLVLIFAPVFEEILFRGWIVDGFISQRLRPNFAIFFSAFLFASCHAPTQALGAFLFAMSLSQIRKLMHGSLRVNFLVHALNNCFGIYMLLGHHSLL